jgi:hypothetical protein
VKTITTIEITDEVEDAATQALADEAMRVHALPEDEQFETDNIFAEAQMGTDPLWISGRADLIAQRALTAALPLIEKQAREQCAAEIEAVASQYRIDHDGDTWNRADQYMHAARIVREGK